MQVQRNADAILDALPDPVAVMDLDGHIEYANRQFLLEVGCTREEAQGRTPVDLGIIEDARFAQLKTEIVSGLLSGQSPTHIEILTRQHGTSPYPSLLSFGLVRSETGEPRFIVASARDIGSIRKAQEAATEKERMVQALLHAISEPLLMIDRDGKILACNETAARRLKRSIQDMVGAPLVDCLMGATPPDVARGRLAHIAEVIQSRKGIHFRDQRDDLTLENRIYPILDDRGDVARIVIFARDITEQVRAQTELQKYHERMQDAERLASLGMLSATLAHELAQPLSVIRLANETAIAELEKTGCRDTILQDLRASVTACEPITAIVSQFRNQATRSMKTNETEVRFRNVAELTIRLLEQSARQAKVTLGTQGLDTLPPIRMRENELEQIFFILTRNAIEAADGIEDHYLLIAGVAHDNEIELRFEDNCGGIKPADMPRLCEPFFTTKPPGKGTGLGLSIVRRIAHERNGRISIQNRYGEGVTFVVTLPRR